jgi:tRNA dimethylallyltransferase
MLADLARDDPETHDAIDRANPMRVQRAWEVLAATDRGLADWHRAETAPVLDRKAAVSIVLSPDKDILNKRIEARFQEMLECGALEECRRFRDSGIPLTAPAGRALGARELMAHLDGRMGLDEAATLAVTATRRYAKRQRTWFRNRFADWTWLDPGESDPLAAVPQT